MTEQVTVYGAGVATVSFTPDDPAADQAAQRYSVWGQVVAFAAAQQDKYLTTGSGERDTKPGQEE